MRSSLQQGQKTGHLPVIDLNQERTRGVLIGFVALAVPLIALAAGLTFKAVHYMDSTEFCGMACHKVMEHRSTPPSSARRMSASAAPAATSARVQSGL